MSYKNSSTYISCVEYTATHPVHVNVLQWTQTIHTNIVTLCSHKQHYIIHTNIVTLCSHKQHYNMLKSNQEHNKPCKTPSCTNTNIKTILQHYYKPKHHHTKIKQDTTNIIGTMSTTVHYTLL